jgi:hypothetical protein
MAISTSGSTCTGTLTVSWSGVQGKGVTGVTWGPYLSLSTGTLIFPSGGVQLSPPKKSDSVQVGFTLTTGTGTAEVTVQGFAKTISNTVGCGPDLKITNISQPDASGYTVTVQNIGNVTADVTNVAVQGYYTSLTDKAVFPPPGGPAAIPGGDPACGTTIVFPLPTSLAPGDSVAVVVSCSLVPTTTADTNLMVGVDVSNSVAESNENNNVDVIALT